MPIASISTQNHRAQPYLSRGRTCGHQAGRVISPGEFHKPRRWSFVFGNESMKSTAKLRLSHCDREWPVLNGWIPFSAPAIGCPKWLTLQAAPTGWRNAVKLRHRSRGTGFLNSIQMCLFSCHAVLTWTERSKKPSLFASLPAWGRLPAVKNGRVFAVNGHAYFSRPGPRLIDGLEILSRIIQPEIFSGDVAPEVAQRIPVERDRARGYHGGPE